MLKETKTKLLNLYQNELKLTEEKEKLYTGDEPNPYTQTIIVLNNIINNINKIQTIN